MATTRSLLHLRRDLLSNGLATSSRQGHRCNYEGGATRHGDRLLTKSFTTSTLGAPIAASTSHSSIPRTGSQRRHLFTLSVLFAPSPPNSRPSPDSNPNPAHSGQGEPEKTDGRTISKKNNVDNVNNNTTGDTNPQLPKFDLSSLGLSKNMKILIYTLILIFGTIETYVYCQALWHWWQRRTGKISGPNSNETA